MEMDSIQEPSDHNLLVGGEAFHAVGMLANELGYLFNKPSEYDKGIDAEIEITRKAYQVYAENSESKNFPEGYFETENLKYPFIGLQIKGRSHVQRNANGYFTLRVKESNLEYWKKYGRPVILILYTNKNFYWTRVDDLESVNIKINANRVFNSSSLNEFILIIKQFYEEIARINEIEKKKEENRNRKYANVIRQIENNAVLAEEIQKGAFNSSSRRTKEQFNISTPNVLIECKLPIGLEHGDCNIKFSNITLRGLSCDLTHEDILTDLMIGLDTPPHLKTRPFIHEVEEGYYKANLGQTSVILTNQEAVDLCSCVDKVCQIYKEVMLETIRILDAYNYTYLNENNEKGFFILEVERWVWNLMKQFANEFNYDEGKSDWHIFEYSAVEIIVYPQHTINAILRPTFDEINLYHTKSSREAHDTIKVIYDDYPVKSSHFIRAYNKKETEESLEDVVGPKGIWTVSYTANWLQEEFIPKVLTYYLRHNGIDYQIMLDENKSTFNQKNTSLLVSLYNKFVTKQENMPLRVLSLTEIKQIQVNATNTAEHTTKLLKTINNPQQLTNHLHEIQSRFHTYGVQNVPASILRPYYKVFADLAKCIDPKKLNTFYVHGRLSSFLEKEDRIRFQDEKSYFEDILRLLEVNAERISKVDFENASTADLISRAFIGILKSLENCDDQSLLNTFKTVVLTLWQHCNFETNYCR